MPMTTDDIRHSRAPEPSAPEPRTVDITFTADELLEALDAVEQGLAEAIERIALGLVTVRRLLGRG